MTAPWVVQDAFITCGAYYRQVPRQVANYRPMSLARMASTSRVHPMGKEERLSRLVCEIYDSALDPTLWPEALGNIAGFVGGPSAGLISRDSVSKAGNAHYTFGCNPHYLQLYLDRYAKLDSDNRLTLLRTGTGRKCLGLHAL